MLRTISTSQESPANALALNKDLTNVVIAGRNVFKIFAIEEDEFVELYNLRVGKNINLNYSCNDVAWSTNDDNCLATAATNGAVVVWNLQRVSRSKQEYVFSEHERTVNKVCFSPTDPFWLMSGSQDGTMKMFDLRTRETVRTFLSNAESVRDVQFSTTTAGATFASVSENGNVQTWDVRRSDRCILQFTAHSGPIFSCDWHPDHPWLATASRDKTIKVWDMTSKPTADFTIHTIASVGRVKWRPQCRWQIASAALVVDSSISVWDIRRPYIPYSVFSEHKDVATCIAWRDSLTLLSTSRDCTLYQHSWRDAVDMSTRINPHGLTISAVGQIAFACRATLANAKTSKMSGILKKVGNIATGAPIVAESEFSKPNVSAIYFYSQITRETDFFVSCARGYRLSGAPLAEICEHNSKVAAGLGQVLVSHVWEVVRAVYECARRRGELGGETDSAPPSPGPRPLSSDPDNYDSKIGELLFRSNVEDLGGGEPESTDEVEDWTLPLEAFSGHEQPFLPLDCDPAPEDGSEEGEEDDFGLVGIQVETAAGWEPYAILAAALRHQATAQSDVQTPACVLLAVAPSLRARLLHHLDDDTVETWLLAYIDLLCRFGLYVQSNQVMKLSWLNSVSESNQDSTTVHTGCGRCSRSLNVCGWACIKCGHRPRCALCNNIVRGMYAWCQGCMHGGHIEHMRDWISKHSYCPSGCGHACHYS